MQAEIVFWLAEATDVAATGDKTNSPDWRKVPLRPGALFVVGDPKQSIYRFRRADIDIYNIVRGRFSTEGVGVVLPLTMNFRSGPELCARGRTPYSRRAFRRSRPRTRLGLRRSTRSRSRPFAARCAC